MKFILIRHTETDWNTENRLQGQTDTFINATGLKQAYTLAKELAPFNISRIVSSDLRRASQTAQIILETIPVPHHVDTRLRECSFGSLEGFTGEQVRDWYGFSHYSEGSYDYRSFGGESKDEILKRHHAAFDEYAAKHQGEVLLMIGHGSGFNTFLASLGQEPTLKRGQYRIIEY